MADRLVTARFDDHRTGTAWLFPAPERVVIARRSSEVRPALDQVEAACAAGNWAHGFVAYEAAHGIDPVLPRPAGADGPPLVWFAITAAPVPAGPATQPAGGYAVGQWRMDWTGQQYRAAVERVRAHIARGDAYQVNLTTRLRARFTGDPLGLYHDLGGRQRSGQCAYLDTGRHVVVSASPESFLEWSGDTITCRPMKGTARRGATPTEDREALARLRADPKEHAENVMIVDLMRNDLSRIAVTGTVRTTDLVRAEPYPTVWQLTSTVECRVPRQTTLGAVLGALFPCGSITGAPKRRTMEIIAAVEPTPRGVYCGAIGFVAPQGNPVRARFSVAIRTAVLDRVTDEIVYGVGGGITWASDARREYEEAWAKALVLGAGRD